MKTTRTSPRARPGTPAQVRVRFELRSFPAREVFLAGSFNDWHPGMFPLIEVPGGWVKEVLLPPGTYEYLFVADGRWLADPGNSRTAPNPFGGVNSVVEVVSPSPALRSSRVRESTAKSA